MADVMARSSDRGQLLLVTALALAVILVAVALLLNAAIFTENVATRDTTTEGAEAIELRGELVEAIGELIEIENRQGDGLASNVTAGIDAMKPLADHERARYGTVATLARNGSATPGQLLRWADPDDPQQFNTTDSNWTLVDGLTDSRAFRLNLSAVDSGTGNIESDSFGVRFVTDSAENVTYYFYEDGDRIIVDRATESTDPSRQCAITHNGANTIVDLTGDRLSTDSTVVECYQGDGLWPDFEPDEIQFRNGEAATGTFEITVDDEATPTTDSAVQNTTAVYSVPVDIGYRSSKLDFETTVTVAPGEPR